MNSPNPIAASLQVKPSAVDLDSSFKSDQRLTIGKLHTLSPDLLFTSPSSFLKPSSLTTAELPTFSVDLSLCQTKTEPNKATASAAVTNSKAKQESDKQKQCRRKSRKPWSSNEDASLAQLMKCFKSSSSESINWSEVAKRHGTGRTGKQCRDRWLNHLRSGIKKGKWTEEEEALLLEMYNTFGPRWAAMAKLFKNRTDNDVKNKWNSMKRKEKRAQEKENKEREATAVEMLISCPVASFPSLLFYTGDLASSAQQRKIESNGDASTVIKHLPV